MLRKAPGKHCLWGQVSFQDCLKDPGHSAAPLIPMLMYLENAFCPSSMWNPGGRDPQCLSQSNGDAILSVCTMYNSLGTLGSVFLHLLTLGICSLLQSQHCTSATHLFSWGSHLGAKERLLQRLHTQDRAQGLRYQESYLQQQGHNHEKY